MVDPPEGGRRILKTSLYPATKLDGAYSTQPYPMGQGAMGQKGDKGLPQTIRQ